MTKYFVVPALLAAAALGGPARAEEGSATNLGKYLGPTKNSSFEPGRAGAAASHFQGYTKGMQDISLSGSIQSVEDITSVSINGGLGFFMNEHFEPGIMLGLTHVSGGGSDFTTFNIGGFLNYHFHSTSDTVPYVGVAIGGSLGDGPDVTTFDAYAGINHFFQPNNAVFVQAGLRHTTNGSSHTGFLALLGLRIFRGGH